MTTSTGTPTTSTSGVGKPYEKAKTIIDLVDNLMSEMVNDKLSSPAGVDVEGPYERAQNLSKILRTTATKINQSRVRKANFESSIETAEMELISTERGLNPTMSMAAFERHLKVVFHDDDKLKDLKAELANETAYLSNLEVTEKQDRAFLQMESARMYELGGYLHYLSSSRRTR